LEVRKREAQPRRTKISPIPKSDYNREVKSDVLDPQDQAKNTQKPERNLKTIPEQRQKTGNFSQEIPDVLKQVQKREKRRFTAMLEPCTIEYLQELKATKKIKSVSGVIETALEEFFNKYNLK